MNRLIAFLVVFFGAVASAASPSDLLAEAEALYAEALEISVADRAEGREAFARVAAAYQALVDAGVKNASIQRNLGNAYMASGELGEAIVAYRRAERDDPYDSRVAAALAEARERVRSIVEPGLQTRTEQALLWWRGVIPRAWMAWAGLAGWAAACLVLLLKKPGAKWGVAVGVVFAMVGLGSLFAESALEGREAVVVVQDGVTARLGPDDAVYDEAFTEPVREGVEGVVIERRGEWARIRLRSGQQAWLPGWALGTI
ncbi:MAG: tetratricopeptide repeat protein [Planctomycetota bacterium]